MMRYALLIAAIVLAACAEPPINKSIPVSPTIEITAPKELEAQKAKEHKPQAPKATPAPPVPDVHPCAGIDAGELRDTIKEKLECLKEHIEGQK
jgi:hypothetical protein